MNKLGIYVEVGVPQVDKDGNPYTSYKYVDFKYINVTYGEATPTLTLTPSVPPTQNNLASILQTNQYSASLDAVFKVNNMDGSTQADKTYFIPGTTVGVSDQWINITWSGTSFSGSRAPKSYFSDEISGTVSSDGNTLVTLDYKSHYISTDTSSGVPWIIEETIEIRLQNVPISPGGPLFMTIVNGSGVQSCVATITDHTTNVKNGQQISESTLVSPVWSQGTPAIKAHSSRVNNLVFFQQYGKGEEVTS